MQLASAGKVSMLVLEFAAPTPPLIMRPVSGKGRHDASQ